MLTFKLTSRILPIYQFRFHQTVKKIGYFQNLHKKGYWKMSKMEILDPKETKKFKKQKWKQICWTPCIKPQTLIKL